MTKVSSTSGIASRRQQRAKEPLEVRLTVRFKFGHEAEDVVTMMNNRAVPMVGSVFKSRDRIVRSFVRLLVRAGAAQPKVARELLPLLRLLKRRPAGKHAANKAKTKIKSRP